MKIKLEQKHGCLHYMLRSIWGVKFKKSHVSLPKTRLPSATFTSFFFGQAVVDGAADLAGYLATEPNQDGLVAVHYKSQAFSGKILPMPSKAHTDTLNTYVNNGINPIIYQERNGKSHYTVGGENGLRTPGHCTGSSIESRYPTRRLRYISVLGCDYETYYRYGMLGFTSRARYISGTPIIGANELICQVSCRIGSFYPLIFEGSGIPRNALPLSTDISCDIDADDDDTLPTNKKWNGMELAHRWQYRELNKKLIVQKRMGDTILAAALHTLTDQQREKFDAEYRYADALSDEPFSQRLTRVLHLGHPKSNYQVAVTNERLVLYGFDGDYVYIQEVRTFHSYDDIPSGTPAFNGYGELVCVVTASRNNLYAIGCKRGVYIVLPTEVFEIENQPGPYVYAGRVFDTQHQLEAYIEDPDTSQNRIVLYDMGNTGCALYMVEQGLEVGLLEFSSSAVETFHGGRSKKKTRVTSSLQRQVQSASDKVANLQQRIKTLESQTKSGKNKAPSKPADGKKTKQPKVSEQSPRKSGISSNTSEKKKKNSKPSAPETSNPILTGLRSLNLGYLIILVFYYLIEGTLASTSRPLMTSVKLAGSELGKLEEQITEYVVLDKAFSKSVQDHIAIMRRIEANLDAAIAVYGTNAGAKRPDDVNLRVARTLRSKIVNSSSTLTLFGAVEKCSGHLEKISDIVLGLKTRLSTHSAAYRENLERFAHSHSRFVRASDLTIAQTITVMARNLNELAFDLSDISIEFSKGRYVWSEPRQLGFFDIPVAEGATISSTTETARAKRHSNHVKAAGWHLGSKDSDVSCSTVNLDFTTQLTVEGECSKNSSEHYLSKTVSYCGMGYSGIVYTGKGYAAEGLINSNISRPVRCSLACLPHRVLIELISRQPLKWACQAPIIAVVGKDRVCKKVKTADPDLEIFADAIEITHEETECTWKLKHQLPDDACAPSKMRKVKEEQELSYIKGKYVCSVASGNISPEKSKLLTRFSEIRPSTYINIVISLFVASYATRYTNILIGALAFAAVYQINLAGASSCSGPVLVNRASISTTDLDDGVQYAVSANLGTDMCIEVGDSYVLRTKKIETGYSYTYMYSSTPASWHLDCCKWSYDCMTVGNKCDRDLCDIQEKKNVKKFTYCGAQKSSPSSSCAFSGAMNTQVDAVVSLDENSTTYLSIWKMQTTAMFEHVKMELKDANGVTKDITAERGDTLENWDQMVFETFRVTDMQKFEYVAKMGKQYYCAHVVPEKPKCVSHDIQHPYVFFDKDCIQPNFVWEGDNYKCVLPEPIVNGLIHSYFTDCPSYMNIVSEKEELTVTYTAPRAFVRFQTKLKVVTSIFPACETVEISDISAEKGDNKEYKVSVLLVKGNTATKCQLKLRVAKCNVVGPSTAVVQNSFYVKFNVLCGLLIPDRVEFVMSSGASVYHAMPAGVFRDIDFAFYQTYHTLAASVYTVNSTWLDNLSLSTLDLFNYSGLVSMMYSLAKMALAAAAIYFAAVSLTTGNWIVAAFFLIIPLWIYQPHLGVRASPLSEALQQTNLMLVKAAHLFAVGVPIENQNQSLSVAEFIIDIGYAYIIYLLYAGLGFIMSSMVAIILYTRNPVQALVEVYRSPKVVVRKEAREIDFFAYMLAKAIPNKQWVEKVDSNYTTTPNGHPTFSRYRYTGKASVTLPTPELMRINAIVREQTWNSFEHNGFSVWQIRYKTVFMSLWRKNEDTFLVLCRHNYKGADSRFIVHYDDLTVIAISGYNDWDKLYQASQVLRASSGDLAIGRTYVREIEVRYLNITEGATKEKRDQHTVSVACVGYQLVSTRSGGWLGMSGMCVKMEDMFFIQQTDDPRGKSRSVLGYVSLREDLRQALIDEEKVVIADWQITERTTNVRRTQRMKPEAQKLTIRSDIENLTAIEFRNEHTVFVELEDPLEPTIGTEYQVLLVNSLDENVEAQLETILSVFSDDDIVYLTASHRNTSSLLPYLIIVGGTWSALNVNMSFKTMLEIALGVALRRKTA